MTGLSEISMPSGEIAQGGLVVVVGPSGAGKDSIMAYAMNALAHDPRFGLVRRVITRPMDSGGEAHEAASNADFEAMKSAGRFAVTWTAHGMSYGIPFTEISAAAFGKIVLVNGSRSALPLFDAVAGNLRTVLVTASPETRAMRLAARGRERQEEILTRLGRVPEAINLQPDCRIENEGRLEDGGNQLVRFLVQLDLAWDKAGRLNRRSIAPA